VSLVDGVVSVKAGQHITVDCQSVNNDASTGFFSGTLNAVLVQNSTSATEGPSKQAGAPAHRIG
jgi:hypothetical protein